MKANAKVLVRMMIGDNGKEEVRRLIRKVRYLGLIVLHRAPLLTKIYYVLFSNTYDREIKSVVAGQLAQIKNKQGGESVNFHLRRSIHRIEKGLAMRPLRPVFGLDIINATVSSYEKATRQFRGG